MAFNRAPQSLVAVRYMMLTGRQDDLTVQGSLARGHDGTCQLGDVGAWETRTLPPTDPSSALEGLTPGPMSGVDSAAILVPEHLSHGED